MTDSENLMRAMANLHREAAWAGRDDHTLVEAGRAAEAVYAALERSRRRADRLAQWATSAAMVLSQAAEQLDTDEADFTADTYEACRRISASAKELIAAVARMEDEE